jgi:phosphonate transport system ATP-binding protein
MTPAPYAAATPHIPVGATFTTRLLQRLGKSVRDGDKPQLPPPGAHAIDIKALGVERGGRTVLDDLSLTIASGEITAVVGPSGAGKSTFLAALTGLVTPKRGRILVGAEQDLGNPAVLKAHRLSTATIFQEHALIDRLSALDNVLLGLADSRHPLSPLPWPQHQETQAAQALADVGLLHLAHRWAGNLSGGERQRVGIARALVRKPAILLGDEPFSAIDPALSRRLGNEFRALVGNTGITVVLVLHQMDMARALADRVVGLAQGGIVFNGPAVDFDEAAQDHLFSLARPGDPFDTSLSH